MAAFLLLIDHLNRQLLLDHFNRSTSVSVCRAPRVGGVGGGDGRDELWLVDGDVGEDGGGDFGAGRCLCAGGGEARFGGDGGGGDVGHGDGGGGAQGLVGILS